MIETIFTNLTYALRGNPYIAVFVSFSRWILSIVLRSNQLAPILLIVGLVALREIR